MVLKIGVYHPHMGGGTAGMLTERHSMQNRENQAYCAYASSCEACVFLHLESYFIIEFTDFLIVLIAMKLYNAV